MAIRFHPFQRSEYRVSLQAGQVCTPITLLSKVLPHVSEYGLRYGANHPLELITGGFRIMTVWNHSSFPSFIQAVEKSSILVIEKQAQEFLFQKIPQLERYFRIIFQRAYTAQLNRIHFILNLSGEERYHHFHDAFPDFVQRVPQYMLALTWALRLNF